MYAIAPDGASIYYEVHGSGAEAVLLIMGLGAVSFLWEGQIAAMGGRYQVIVMDNRGIGRSDKPPGHYTTALMAQDAISVLDACNIQRAHVIGISMGGMIAQELALNHPDRVGALVLAATYARSPAGIDQAVSEAVARLPGQRRIEPAPGQVDALSVVLGLMQLAFSQDFLVREQARLTQIMMRAAAFGFHPPAFVGQMQATATHDTTDRLPALRRPTLVLTGDADRLIPPRCSHDLASLIPQARLCIIEGGSHTLNIEHETHFNEAVLGFLADHPLPGPA
jgi:pimeloyl-ACP methyl ester carboxylesterase